MRKIKINSRRRHGRKSRSSYASAALCIAAFAIALCAAVIRVQKDKSSITGDVSSDSTSSQSAESSDNEATAPSSEDSISSQTPQTSSDKIQNTNPANTANASPADEFEDFEDSEQTLAIQTIGPAGGYVRPVGGAVTKEYSMTGLVYSRTMGDWRVHNGLDISANEGEIVKSAAEGTVAGIVEDPLYGTTVVINQNDGLMVYYRGLNKDTAVRQGENISAGTTIGTVGEIPCESGDGSHIHIEVMRENSYLSPAETLGLK